ncbi:MAG: hypothetical protein FWD78_04570 [Treponema sp.]|nr:hypothetical protein [Treponema sp.]
MKVQFKYAFRTGIFVRGPVFAVIAVMDLVFIMLGIFGFLPFAAQVTAVSLGGVAIAAMLAADIIGDAAIVRRMFGAQESFLQMLTPQPRRRTLAASVITMAVLDILTMAAVIVCEVWLSLKLAGSGVWKIGRDTILANPGYIYYIICIGLLFIAGYFLVIMIIMFCITVRKSFLYRVAAPGFLTFLLGCGCFYAVSLLQLLLAPFSTIQRYGLIIILNYGKPAAALAVVLTLLEAAALFAVTSKLMERKINL